MAPASIISTRPPIGHRVINVKGSGLSLLPPAESPTATGRESFIGPGTAARAGLRELGRWNLGVAGDRQRGIDEPFDISHFFFLVGGGKRDRVARTSGASRAPDTVHVILDVIGD